MENRVRHYHFVNLRSRDSAAQGVLENPPLLAAAVSSLALAAVGATGWSQAGVEATGSENANFGSRWLGSESSPRAGASFLLWSHDVSFPFCASGAAADSAASRTPSLQLMPRCFSNCLHLPRTHCARSNWLLSFFFHCWAHGRWTGAWRWLDVKPDLLDCLRLLAWPDSGTGSWVSKQVLLCRDRALARPRERVNILTHWDCTHQISVCRTDLVNSLEAKGQLECSLLVVGLLCCHIRSASFSLQSSCR